jgi:hypothetical protein
MQMQKTGVMGLDVACLVIGADNLTRRITAAQQQGIVDRVCKDFEVRGCTRRTGGFRGAVEDCIQVEVGCPPDFAWRLGCIQQLRTELGQEGIGVQIDGHYLRVIRETFLVAYSTMVIHRPSIRERQPGAIAAFLKAFGMFREIGDLLVFTDELHAFDGMCNRFLSMTIPYNIGKYFETYDGFKSCGCPMGNDWKMPSWLGGAFAFTPEAAWFWVRNDEAATNAGTFVQDHPRVSGRGVIP